MKFEILMSDLTPECRSRLLASGFAVPDLTQPIAVIDLDAHESGQEKEAGFTGLDIIELFKEASEHSLVLFERTGSRQQEHVSQVYKDVVRHISSRYSGAELHKDVSEAVPMSSWTTISQPFEYTTQYLLDYLECKRRDVENLQQYAELMSLNVRYTRQINILKAAETLLRK